MRKKQIPSNTWNRLAPWAALIVATLACACTLPNKTSVRMPSSVNAITSFVTRSDSQFIVDGRPVQWVGANANLLQGPHLRSSIEQVFTLSEHRISAARVWAFNDGASGETRSGFFDEFYFRTGPTGWREDAFVALDRMLVIAREKNIRLILVLSNYWGDFGGIPQYYDWFHSSHAPRRGGGKRPNNQDSIFFYLDPSARDAYREHVRRIVTRVNSRNGLAYKDDPTILGYELMNESQVNHQVAAAHLNWMREMSDYVRSLDSNHLISTGFERLVNPDEVEARQAREIAALASVDYMDAHLYPGVQAPTTLDGFREVFSTLGNLSRQVFHKPIIIGEIGVEQSYPGLQIRPTDTPLDQTYMLMEASLARGGLGGAFFWHLSGAPTTMPMTVLPAGAEFARFWERIEHLNRMAKSRVLNQTD